MTITITKKHLFALLGIVACAIIFFLAVNSFGKADYETTAKDMKLNAMVAASISQEILADYQKNWSSAISDHRAINSDGKSEYCSEFSEAIAWRYIFFTKKGYISVLDSVANIVKEDMKIMEDAPSKFEETQKSFLAMYNDMNTLISLVKDPKGSLMTFGQRVNEILLDFEKRYNETDLKISISDADKNQKAIDIQEVINNLLANSPEKQAEMKANKENKEKGERFMEMNAKKEGVNTLPSGVQYKVIKEGTGVIPSDTSLVKVHYEGRLIDDEIFDSSYKRGEPALFRVNQVVKGWSDALTHMPEGSVWEVYIPQDMAYGEREQNIIKPYSALIFKIELIKVNPRR